MDVYNRAARLSPVYLAFAPAVVLVIALALGTSALWSKLAGIAVACGGPMFAQQLGRSAGKRRESELMSKWGGAPTTVLLRHRSPGNDPTALRHRHDAVEAATGIPLPTAAEEGADPVAADGAYEASVRTLRELTRDGEQFSLVLDELVNYGFRRNLWGLKPFGVGIAVGAALVSAALLVWELVDETRFSPLALLLSLGFALAVLVAWMLIVTREWVKQAAFEYAERLLASAEGLKSEAAKRDAS